MTKFFLEYFYTMGYNLRNARNVDRAHQNTKMVQFEAPGINDKVYMTV